MNHIEQALSTFETNFNCAQSVCSGFAEDFGLERDLALKVSAGFGGGIGGMANICGAVSGAIIILGLKYGATDADDSASKSKTYERVREFTQKFSERHGALLCRELLETDISTPEGRQHANECKLFSERCPEFIKSAGEILEQMLKEEE